MHRESGVLHGDEPYDQPRYVGSWPIMLEFTHEPFSYSLPCLGQQGGGDCTW